MGRHTTTAHLARVLESVCMIIVKYIVAIVANIILVVSIILTHVRIVVVVVTDVRDWHLVNG